MLPLMLMLVADPLTAPPRPAPPAPGVRIDAEGVMRAVVRPGEAAPQDCRNGEFQQARTAPVVVEGQYRGQPFTVTTRGPAPVLNDLMLRQGDPVSVTLLLERRIGQCSAPISYDVTTPDGRLPSFPARAD